MDALVVLFVPPLATHAAAVARATVRAAGELGGRKPVLSVFLSSRGVPAELRSAPLVEGSLGGHARDIAAVADVLVRLSALAEDLPEVAELDCDPLLVLEQGAVVLDARVRLEPAEPPLPLGARA